MPQLQLDGARLHYEEAGRGPETIVFSHGLLWSGRMFDEQVGHFKDRYRCVTFDFRGQGESEVTPTGYDMETLTTDAAQVIEKLGAAPCHFAGLSMGGFVGLRLALRRPELLRSLVLLESAADPEPRANLPKYGVLLLIARLFGLGLVAGPVMKIMFGDAFLADPARAAERAEWRRRLTANDRIGVVRATMGVITRAPVEHLEQIRTPTLVISGEGDRAVVTERSRRTAQAIAGARLVTIPRAGHTSTVEEPAAVNAAIDQFLASLRQAAAS